MANITLNTASIMSCKKRNPITPETVLIHYIGPTKPWHEWANYPTAQPFISAKDASPWKDIRY